MTRAAQLTGLFAFHGGFVDTIGLLGLHGLFLAHVTGNLATLAAALVLGERDVIAKALSLPEFVAAIILTRLAARYLVRDGAAALRVLFSIPVALLLCFFLLAVGWGPVAGQDTVRVLFMAGLGVSAMAMQNALLSTYYTEFPPTTFMSGNMLHAVLDATDLAYGIPPEQRAAARMRLARGIRSIFFFAIGCGVAALLFHVMGFWSLALSLLVGAAGAGVAINTGPGLPMRAISLRKVLCAQDKAAYPRTD